MSRYELRVMEDRLRAGAVLELPAANRVVYVVEGRLYAAADGREARPGANEAWHGGGQCRLTVAGEGALVWRWELTRPEQGDAGNGPERLKLAREVELEPGARYLMRCDRVDFPPGGVAYAHTHQGPGIRVLLLGEFRVETAGRTLAIAPGEAWFESGPEPVYAEGSKAVPSSFVRVMILPVALQGKSSIRYVKPEDQDRPKSQRYTVFIDTPISL